MKKQNKIEPVDPFQCWCTPCGKCVWFNEETKHCDHPEYVLMEEWISQTAQKSFGR